MYWSVPSKQQLGVPSWCRCHSFVAASSRNEASIVAMIEEEKLKNHKGVFCCLSKQLTRHISLPRTSHKSTPNFKGLRSAISHVSRRRNMKMDFMNVLSFSLPKLLNNENYLISNYQTPNWVLSGTVVKCVIIKLELRMPLTLLLLGSGRWTAAQDHQTHRDGTSRCRCLGKRYYSSTALGQSWIDDIPQAGGWNGLPSSWPLLPDLKS